MRNTKIIGGSLIAVAVLGAAPAFAQSKDLTVTLGLKAWENNWQTALGATGPFAGGGSNVIDVTSGGKLAAIPSVTVKWQDWFVSGGYFTKTSYGFPNSTQLLFTPPAFAVVGPATQVTTAERKEADLNAGYYFFPGVAVSLGYKQVDQKYTTTFVQPAFSVGNGTSTTKNKTPTIGLQGSSQLAGTRWFIYGNGAVSPGNTMKATFSTGGASYKGWYASSELGFGYAVSNNVTMTLGAKYQIIDLSVNNVGTNQRARDVTSGFIGGVAYTF